MTAGQSEPVIYLGGGVTIFSGLLMLTIPVVEFCFPGPSEPRVLSMKTEELEHSEHV